MDFFCENRKTPLLIGSIKSNMGHSEPASGLCSIAKMLIAMEEGVIPANLHFREPNPDIPGLLDGRLKVRLYDVVSFWQLSHSKFTFRRSGRRQKHAMERRNRSDQLLRIRRRQRSRGAQIEPQSQTGDAPERIHTQVDHGVRQNGRSRRALIGERRKMPQRLGALRHDREDTQK